MTDKLYSQQEVDERERLLRADAAAVLEKIPTILDEHRFTARLLRCTCGWTPDFNNAKVYDWQHRIHILQQIIPTTYADALQERIRRERHEAWTIGWNEAWETATRRWNSIVKASALRSNPSQAAKTPRHPSGMTLDTSGEPGHLEPPAEDKVCPTCEGTKFIWLKEKGYGTGCPDCHGTGKMRSDAKETK